MQFRRQLAIAATIFVAALLFVLVIASGTYADESKTQIFVANTNPEFVVGNPDNPANSYTVEVLVEGGQPGALFVEFVDYVTGPQGRMTLPGGSSPNSLQNAIYLATRNTQYFPSGESQIFALKFLPFENLEPRLYSGGMRIGFRPDSGESGFSASTLGVVKNLVVTPFGGASVLGKDQLRAANLVTSHISPLERSSFIDSLIPDIPGVINHGPVQILSVIENPGEYPLFASVRWEIRSNEELLAVQEMPSKMIGGGLSLERKIQTVFVDPTTGRSINVIPNLGLIDLRTLVTSELTGVTLETEIRTQTFVVFMWKEPTVFVILILLTGFMARSYYKKRKGIQSPEVSLLELESSRL